MRSVLAVAGLALCSSSVLAADFGIGIAARSSDDGSLYFPIDIGESFRIEPGVRYVEREVLQGRDSTYDETKEIGLGAFGRKKVSEAARVYYGVRAWYAETETSYRQSFRVVESMDGYELAPTLGFEYLFGKHFSVGGEVAYSFLQLEGEFRQVQIRRDMERDYQGTQTRVVARYMF